MIKPRNLNRHNVNFHSSYESLTSLARQLEASAKDAKTENGCNLLLNWKSAVEGSAQNYEFCVVELNSLNAEALDQYNDPNQNAESLKKEIQHLQKLVTKYRELLKDNGIKYHTQL